MKKLLIVALLCPLFSFAQKLVGNGSAGDLYLVHKAAAKENWYSIGRIYNVSPKIIAPYNKLSLDQGLSVGQEIRIPLTDNFTAQPKAASGQKAIPVYAKTGNKIIGYLAVNEQLSPLSGNISDEKAIVKSTPAEVREEPAPVMVLPPSKPIISEPAPKSSVTAPVPTSSVSGSGYFASRFTANGKSESGAAGIFKSSSGWEDGKYYCLHNSAEAGTIVKVTNKATGKAVYAKVLDAMPDLKDNKSLVIRVSNAAGSALGLPATGADVSVEY